MALSRSYLASLPERTVRATAALGGGLVVETSQLLLPEVIRRSRLYQATVARLLRIVVEFVGGVEQVYPDDELPVNRLVLRKAAGNVLELAGFVAAGWSPLWLLAAAADVTGGTRAYLRALVDELRAQELLPHDVEVRSVEELLGVLEGTSAVLADTVDVPPLAVEELRRTWQALRAQLAELPDAASLARLYDQLEAVSRREGVSVATTSSTIAAGALQAGVRLGDVHIFGYYRTTLDALATEGLLPYLQRITRPYARGIGKLYDPRTATLTERFI